MALSTDWQTNVKLIWNEVSSFITNARTLDVKNLTIRDYLTLIGLGVTGLKSLYAGYQVYAAFKEYGVARLMKPNLVDRYGTWALMVGADKGLGEAYMTELASCGMNIMIVSFRPEGIRPAAVYLEEKYKVKTVFADIDFSNCKDIYDQIEAEIGDREIGILVSNVNIHAAAPMCFTDIPNDDLRYMIHGNLLSTTLDLRAMLHGNLLAATLSTRLVLPQMIERGRGAIVIMASAAANQPLVHKAVYGATKAYLDYFAKCLNMEYKSTGITVQTLVPAFLAGQGTNIPAFDCESMLVPSPETYAHSAVQTLGWSEHSSGCLSHTVQSWVFGFMPDWFRQWGINTLLSFFQNKAMEHLGVDPEAPMAKATLSFDTSFLSPPSLLGVLGNNSG